MATTTKRTASKKRVSAKKKATAKKAPTKKATSKTKTVQTTKHVEGNPYRAGSFYATIFDCLSKMGSKKPVSRKDLIAASVKASGKEERLVKYACSVVCSPTKEGAGHRSSKKFAYYVERLADGMVQLHMAE
jgi:hypothetical protein